MPKPLFGDNGSGMHTHHFAVEESEHDLFAGAATRGCRDMACYAIGGLLTHAPALCAFTQPDHQQLQAPGARLRGAGQPGLLAA